jgi:hypothetical protein
LDWIHPQQAYIYPEAAKGKRKINTAHTILENRHVAFILNMESWISGHDLTCPWTMTIKTSSRKFKFLQFILVSETVWELILANPLPFDPPFL